MKLTVGYLQKTGKGKKLKGKGNKWQETENKIYLLINTVSRKDMAAVAVPVVALLLSDQEDDNDCRFIEATGK